MSCDIGRLESPYKHLYIEVPTLNKLRRRIFGDINFFFKTSTLSK